MDFSSDDDLHICGNCKQGFSKLDEWLQHKRVRSCINARSGRRPPPRCDTVNGAEAFDSIGCPKSQPQQQQQQQQQQHAGHDKPCRTVESASEQGAAGLKSSCAVRGTEKGKEREQEDDGDDDGDEDSSEMSSSSDGMSDNGTSENHTERFTFVSNGGGCSRGDVQTNGNAHNSFGGDTDLLRGRRGEAGGEAGEPAASRDDETNESCGDGDTDDDGDDEACSTNGDGRGQHVDCADNMQGVVAAGDSSRSIITRNLFPIVRCIRKRERPGVVDAGCPSPGSVGGHSPTSGGGADQPRSVKRKKGYPQRMGSAVLDDASAASESCGTGSSTSHLTETAVYTAVAAAAAAAAASAYNGPDASAAIATILPHKCERCRKGFIKMWHLQRHMNKKKPCKPRAEAAAAACAGAVCKIVDSGRATESSPAEQQPSLPAAPSLPPPPGVAAGSQQTVPFHGFTAGGLVDPAAAAAAAQLPVSKGIFHCGICHSECGTYDTVISHHSSQHLPFYPGYCRFCGCYCDKKADLLLHLSTHTTADVVGEVAAEMKRVRQSKIERLGTLATTISGSSGSGSTGILGGVSSGTLPPPPADQAATQSAVAVACAVCSSVCERETDLLQHHNGCHMPVGLCATLADLRRGRGAEGNCGGAIGTHSLWKNCFICCLKFNEASEFEDHIIYHRTWVSPREQHTVGIVDSWRSTKQERPDDCDGIFLVKNEQRAAAGVTRAACSLASATGHSANGCSVVTPSDNSCSWWSTAKESRLLICWLCPKPFSQYEAWRWHLSGDHGLRPVYQCAHDACRRVFEAWHELAAHSREHAQHAFVCAICNHHASTQSSLLAHAEVHRHLGAPWFPPPAILSCEASPLVSAEHQQQQLLHRGSDSVGLSSNAGDQSQQFNYARYDYTSCELCGHVLPDPQQLEGHLEQCRRHVVQCVDCGQEVHRAKLLHHVTSGHQQPLPPVQLLQQQPLTPAAAAGAATAAGASSPGDGLADAKRFACDLCASAFPVKERLTQHIKNVHGPRKYVCEVCGAAFKRSDKLKRHFSLHSDDRPFVCPYPSCGRGFKRADGLRAHTRYHESMSSNMPGSLAFSGPYVCTRCDAAFESSTSYALHLQHDHGDDILDSVSENGRC